MNRRFYVTQFGFYWSLTEKGYLKFLQDGAASVGWDLSLADYEAREIKNPPANSQPINVTNFRQEHYQEELEYFLKTGGQTGFHAPNDAQRFNEVR